MIRIDKFLSCGQKHSINIKNLIFYDNEFKTLNENINFLNSIQNYKEINFDNLKLKYNTLKNKLNQYKDRHNKIKRILELKLRQKEIEALDTSNFNLDFLEYKIKILNLKLNLLKNKILLKLNKFEKIKFVKGPDITIEKYENLSEIPNGLVSTEGKFYIENNVIHTDKSSDIYVLRIL